jgi:hypothetical protein
MNKYFVALLVSFATSALAATLPLKVNFQGKLVDPATNNPRSGSISMTFNIYDAASSGNLLWGPETQSITVTNGIFSAQLGASLALNPVVFSSGSAYLGVTIAPDSEMTPRSQFVMTPYAYTAIQLVSGSSINVSAGQLMSTFTATGNLLVPYGVIVGTASISGALTASSGTFTATGNNQYSLRTSSGINVSNGGVTAPFISATHYGDGSNLTGITVANIAATNVQNGTLNAGVLLNAGSLTNGPVASSILRGSRWTGA